MTTVPDPSACVGGPSRLARLAHASAVPLAVPICTYPAMALTGATVRQIVSDASANAETQQAFHERYRTPVVLTAMDLSAEAEAFGCEILLSDTDLPTVVGRRVTTAAEAAALRVPEPGEARTGVSIEAARRLARLQARPLVLGGCIGPFSLAARIIGVGEALELTIAEPGLVHAVLEKSAAFLAAYAAAARDAGAGGLVMAEPAAGLLSPRGMAEFSSAYVRPIAQALGDGPFALILHNCAARLPHLGAMLQAGTGAIHVGAPMDLPGALPRVPPDVVVCGNLDPVRTFVQAAPEETGAHVRQLLDAVGARPNFVLSSGCDIPPEAPLGNVDAFFEAARGRARL